MFSIIIPARLNSKMLQNTINKILEQSYANFEIVIILDFEEEGLIKNDRIKYIFSGIKSPGEKRNLGLLEAKGSYVAFLDDDAYPDINWLNNSLELFDKNPEYIAVCGPSITPLESEFLEKISGFIYESFLASGPTRYRHVPLKHRFVDDYPSVNLIIRKEVLKEIDGFDDKYWPGEDTKFCLDLVNKFGRKIYYSPLLKVYHHRRSVYHPHLIQLSRYAAHRGFFAKKFPRTSLKFSYFVPSLFLIYIFFLPVFFIFDDPVRLVLLAPALIYVLLMFIEVINTYIKSSSIAASILTALGIFLSNTTYGIFFIKGLASKPELVLREVDIVNEKYIKG